MYFALGLLTAGLLALLVMPAILRRAARLTRARVEANRADDPAPRSRADKDQLRANFAIANRKLEIDSGRLKEKLAEEVIEVNRRRDEIAILTRNKAVLTDSVAGLEERVAELTGALATSEAKLATAYTEINTRDQRLADSAAALASLQVSLGASQARTEEHRLELAARAADIEHLTDNLAAMTETEAANRRRPATSSPPKSRWNATALWRNRSAPKGWPPGSTPCNPSAPGASPTLSAPPRR